MKLVALYVRVSTGRQADFNLSIPDQIESGKRWCEQNNYKIVKIYRDEGVSGTDDRRPEFQNMMADACCSGKPPFEIIVVHSLSRFFRDEVEFSLHERQLAKHGISIASVTQEATNNTESEFIRRILAMIDEQNSKENAKHTLRCMKRNAERGFFNGSSIPFGYRLQETDEPARTGRKKLLVIDPLEAPLVKRIYNLYIERNLGVKGIASQLNTEGITRRGSVWSTTSIHDLLTNTVYKGEKLFNQKHWRTREKKDDSEIIRIPVEPIVSPETFEMVRLKLMSRSPKRSHPRRLSSPRLLTGLLRCGECGAAMTMATGKSNTYFYYRCTTRTKKHLDLCSSKMVPMEKMDTAVLSALADKVFTPERVAIMLKELKLKMGTDNGASIGELMKQVEMVQFKLKNLYCSIEDGVQIDAYLKQRLDELKRQEKEYTIKVERYEHSPKAVVDSIDQEQVKAFTNLLRGRLLDRTTGFSKEYLQLLVNEIELKGNQATVKGNYVSLVGAIKFAAETKKLSTSQEVLRFNGDWRARTDSNGRQPGSKLRYNILSLCFILLHTTA